MDEIKNRLSMLRTAKGLSRRDVSEATGIKYTTYCHYEDGAMEIKAVALLKIALFYNISVDWLLGNNISETDVPPSSKWDEIRGMLETLSDESLLELKSYVTFLLWKEKQQ